MSLLRQPCLFSFGKNLHPASDIVSVSAAKHQHLDKSLKTKFKALKKSREGHSSQGCCFTFWCVLSTWEKQNKKKPSNRMKMALGLKE